ncbi:PDZ domain-containing protein [Thermomonas sp. HDW16]|uniref:PDZ domain-containing protein n=1 Tax=Thermomonas sp. HDW16 TaxID=2714945 RepID=UPI00140A9EBB|nr:PDZ domain-containing protein [Thermomonas sp. HDW16]QIL19960.1 PDZ domain-containing protein [Thermomonas sp. HDW16]
MNTSTPRPTAEWLSKPTLLALALGVALSGAAIAQSTPTPAQQKQLDAARADLDKAAQRFAELQREYGGADAPIRIEKRVLRKPVIGVLLAPDDAAGVRIAGVTPDSAAAAGGLKSGDRIVSIDGMAIKAANGTARVDEVRERLAALDAKTMIKLGYERDGKTQVVALTPKVGDRLVVFPGLDADAVPNFDDDVHIIETPDGRIDVEADRITEHQPRSERHLQFVRIGDGPRADWAMIAPDVRTEVIRLGNDCRGENCKFPVLAEAFRWNGLNLAAVDAQLGRYFGTSGGVLVLSTGNDLEGLQAGDVIRRIGGKSVNNPREAMEALRAQPADAKVAVDYLRDRNSATAHVSVPKALPFAVPRIAAPRAPGMPGAIEHRKMIFVGEDGKVQTFEDGDGNAPRARTASMSKDGERIQKRRFVMVDKDGKRSEWEGDADDTPPAWVQAMPKDGKRVEKRVQVIVDDKGNKTIIEGDGLPLPPPPAPPKGG